MVVVLHVDAVDSPYAARGDVFGEDRAVDDLNGERGRCRRAIWSLSAVSAVVDTSASSFCSASSRLLPSGRTFR